MTDKQFNNEKEFTDNLFFENKKCVLKAWSIYIHNVLVEIVALGSVDPYIYKHPDPTTRIRKLWNTTIVCMFIVDTLNVIYAE